MDLRKALPHNYILTCKDAANGKQIYRILSEIGRGCNSVAYLAEYTNNAQTRSYVRIKEFYPSQMNFERDAFGTIQTNGAGAFSQEEYADYEILKEKFVHSFLYANELQYSRALGNAVSVMSNIYFSNNTVYVVSMLSQGQLLTNKNFENAREILECMISLTKALAEIHKAGFLYLDLKPSNIFVLEGVNTGIQLFDFDSMKSMKELRDAADRNSPMAISYSEGYAPMEQKQGRIDRLGVTADFYALGAILYEILFGKTPTVCDCDVLSCMDFSKSILKLHSYDDRLYEGLSQLLHMLLHSNIQCRVKIRMLCW